MEGVIAQFQDSIAGSCLVFDCLFEEEDLEDIAVKTCEEEVVWNLKGILLLIKQAPLLLIVLMQDHYLLSL